MKPIEIPPLQHPLQIFGLGYSTPISRQTMWDDLRELHARYYDQKNKEEKILQELKELSMSDVGRARVIAKRAIQEFPYSLRLERFSEILRPPSAQTKDAVGLSRKQEFEWLKENRNKYKGQWVALHKNQCIAAGNSFIEVSEKAKEQTDLKNVLITYFPDSGSL